jgi:hypothetical protein
MFFNKRSFKVKLTGRAGLLYQEGEKSVEIDSEMLNGANYDIVIYKESIEKWNDGLAVDSDEKDRILQNLKSHFESKKYKVDFA